MTHGSSELNHDNPDACDLSQFMVATNAISGCRMLSPSFMKTSSASMSMYVIDLDHAAFLILTQDNYRSFVFDKSERMLDAAPFKSHVTFAEGQDRPTDQFLRLHFQRCLAVSVCGRDPTEDYEEQEIGLFMEELGLYDDTMDFSHPDWETPLGREVYAALVREQETNTKIELVQSGVVVLDTRISESY